MANGTMIGMLEYIEREGITTSESFSGIAGTSPNPYAVEDVYDLDAMACGMSGGTTYYRLVNDIDFNNHATYRFGINDGFIGGPYGTCNVCGRKLNSNNDMYRIRNTIFSGGIFKLCDFTDVILSNIIVNPDTTSSIFNSCKFKNCAVGIFANKVVGAAIMPSAYEHIDTSFNIKGTITSALYTYSKTFTRCRINLDNLNVGGALFDAGTFNNSYVTGSVTPTGSSLDMFCSTVSWTDSYAAIGVNCDSSVTVNVIPTTASANFIGANFIDKGLLPDGANLREVSNLHYLTTEQATDPDYLNSIGFVVSSV